MDLILRQVTQFGYHEWNLNPKLQSSVSHNTYSTVIELTGDRVRAGLKDAGYSIRELTRYGNWLPPRAMERALLN